MAEFVETRQEGAFFYITLNRPKKRNAISAEMYTHLTKVLAQANADEKTTFTVLTGKGEYFSSGSDFDFSKVKSQFQDPSALQEPPYYRFISALFEHRKILVALVNGPAIGIGVTLMSLFDLIVAADDAYFEPRRSLFPQLMGRIPASRMLLFSDKLTAAEAQQFGLITHVLPRAKYEEGCRAILKRVGGLAPGALLECKARIQNESIKKELRHAHEEERAILAKRWSSPELFERMSRVFDKKAKI
ncbi:hypothetical protein M3Y99_00326300 [Aphelenchoides fujianensis]|nr:hypothetical protein M3Y99_00326300 [Aphelenchoides fujianensis]